MARGRIGGRLDEPRAIPHTADDMPFLLPHRIPDRDVVEPRVEDVGDVRSQRGEGGPRCRKGLLRLDRLADKVGGGAAEQVVIQQSPPLGSDADRIDRPVAGDHPTPRQSLDGLQPLHRLCGRLAQIGAVEDHPDRPLTAQLLDAACAQAGDDIVGIEGRAGGGLTMHHAANPPLSVPTGGERRGKRRRCDCNTTTRWR
jgi:hypothetical protein